MHELKRSSAGPSLDDNAEKLNRHWNDRGGYDPAREKSVVAEYKNDALHLMRSWQKTIQETKFSGDLLAGLTVAAVALPLNVALAVACGLPAGAGLIAGAVGGALAAIFGGAPLQVTGPAAALNVLVLAIASQFGAVGVFAAAILVGAMQLAFFFARAGKLAKYVPESVLAGFVTGVGLTLLNQQIPLLLDVEHRVSDLILGLSAPVWLNDVNWFAVLAGMFVILFVLGLQKFKKFPAAIVGIALATGLATYLNWDIHRVGEIPATLPNLAWPDLALEQWGQVFVAAIPLAILAAVESLLSAQAVDRMRKDEEPHKPNLEIFGQGIANIGTGLFGGLTVSGVIVRSTVNVQAGARSRLSSLVHAVLLLAVPLVAATWIGKIPVAALAGLLCTIGYRLIDFETLWHLIKEEKIQAIAFVVAAGGVVTGNLSAGLIGAGVISGVATYLQVRSRRRREKYTYQKKAALPQGIRAQLPAKRIDHFQKAAPIAFRPPDEDWQSHVEAKPIVHPTAFIHENASLIGHVVIGPRVNVASEAALRADEGTPFFVGADTNVQDGVVLHALKKQWVKVGDRNWAIYIGERCSLAHQALVHGPCYIGDDTFIGFKAVVHNAVVGSHCSIGIGAIVVGVEIPDGKFVPPGTLVDTQEKAQSLPPALDAHHHFNEDVVEVNQGLASAYKGGHWELPTFNTVELQKF